MTENALNQVQMPEDIDDTVGILQMVTGRIEGQAFWAYLAMFPSKYQEYVAKVQNNEPVDLMSYGEVIEQGYGEQPPQEVVDRMAAEYGAEPDFEQTLAAMITEEVQKQNS